MDLQHRLVILPCLSSGCVFPISKTAILPFFYFLYFSCWLCLFRQNLPSILTTQTPSMCTGAQVKLTEMPHCSCETDWNIPSVSKTGFFAGLWTSHPLCLLKDMFFFSPHLKKNWKEFQTLLINCKHKNGTENIHIPFNQILLSLTFDPLCFILCALLHAHNSFPEPFEALMCIMAFTPKYFSMDFLRIRIFSYIITVVVNFRKFNIDTILFLICHLYSSFENKPARIYSLFSSSTESDLGLFRHLVVMFLSLF